jgi:hypothetical protein
VKLPHLHCRQHFQGGWEATQFMSSHQNSLRFVFIHITKNNTQRIHAFQAFILCPLPEKTYACFNFFIAIALDHASQIHSIRTTGIKEGLYTIQCRFLGIGLKNYAAFASGRAAKKIGKS